MEEAPLKHTEEDSHELTEPVIMKAGVPFFSSLKLAEMSDIEVARRHIITTRDTISTQLSKLSKLQELLCSDLGIEKEEESLQVTRKLADQVLDTAFKLSAGAGRLVDDIDCLISRLREERDRMEGESLNWETGRTQIGGT